jgi:DNA primase
MIAPRPARNAVDLKALKASVDVLALVRSRGFEPKRHGTEKWAIACPLHPDAEASFIITPRKNLWHCFGCGKGGSAIDLVKELDGLSTGEAIRKLVETATRWTCSAPGAARPSSRTRRRSTTKSRTC